MASDVVIPEVGELGMEVTFVRWLKAPGDDVAVGDPLFEVDTEKSVMVVEAYAEGTLADLAATSGDTVAPRQVIGRILAEGESGAPSEAAPAEQTSTQPGGSSGAVDSSSTAPAAGPGATAGATPVTPTAAPSRSGVSPRARRVAKKLAVDLDAVRGTGPDGLITEADVRAAAESVPTVPTDHAARTRRAVAELTSTSWRTIPHVYLQLEADMESALELAKPTPLIFAAVAQALVRHPECNLRWESGSAIPRETVDLGLLVDTPHGLLITVVPDAADLDLADMADAVREAAARAKSGKLSSADAGQRSLTVSNLGMHSVDRFAAIIPAPDILTLAVGRVRVVPRWQGSSFAPGRVMDLTLSVDHRALDGAAAARMLSALEAVLRDPVSEGLA